VPGFLGELTEEAQNKYLSFIDIVTQYVNELLQAAGKTKSFSYGRVEERSHPITTMQLIKSWHYSALALTALYMALKKRTQQAVDIMSSLANAAAAIDRSRVDPRRLAPVCIDTPESRPAR
jgi:hypothetical protein